MTTQTLPVGIKPHLSAKRAELIWALSQQAYSDSEIASIFNITKQRINVIKSQMPHNWASPWIKVK